MAKKILLTSENCGVCPEMKKMLKDEGIKFKEVSVDNPKGDELANKHGATLIPSMIIDGKLVEDIDDWFV